MKSKTTKFLLYSMFMTLFIASVYGQPVPAQSAGTEASATVSSGRVYNEAAGESEPAIYIVQLADEPLATYTGGVPGLAATSPLATGARKLDSNSPTSLAYEQYLADIQDQFVANLNNLLGRNAAVSFYYRHAYNGVAVFLSPAEAAQVAEMEGVILLYRESEEELLTDAGPEFLGAPAIWGGSYTNREYTALLDGSQEVPPNGSTATGTGTFTYNLLNNELTWHIAHDVAAPTAAHIHSGAPGVNGPIEVGLDHTVNPMVGSTTLSDVQQGLLVNGLLYVNIHTAAFPGGEIRGQMLSTGTMGEGIIIGVIDTGINSSHLSFAAVGGDGYVHTNPYGSGIFVGYCVANPSFCNDKLIGAWALHPSSTNPEDTNGHGSHTAGTAGGNFLQDPVLIAPTETYAFTTVSGVAPHANIIAYQVCVPSCPTSSTTAAVNQAVIDGVDVTNYSISGGSNPYVETTAVAFRNAAAAGVFPANSAGNAGPGAGTVGHQGPWIMTVAASTHNRAILNEVVDLNSDGGPLPDIVGQSPTVGYGPAPLVYAGDAPYNNPLCDPFPGGTFSGEIVVCDRGVIGRVQKGANVLAAGGGGMIMANDAPSAASLNDDPHVLPATHISYVDGITLKAWMAANTNPVGRIAGGVVDYDDVYGDNMASFSSRGPAGSAVPGLANLIKPDVTAPGLNILAPYFAGFTPPPAFNIISGTSMSSPHAAGAAALIRALHPAWTPAEVKSALMMTGIGEVNKEDNTTAGDPFDFGGGRVDLTKAGDVGFVLHITNAEYIAANPAIGGDPKLLNLPSLANNDCAGICTWTRTLRSVSSEDQEYNAWIDGPAGVTGTVTPANFTLPAGGAQVITIELDVTGAALGSWTFAELHIEPQVTESTLSSVPAVSMPIAVIPAAFIGQPTIDVDPDNLESTQFADTTVTQMLTISNLGIETLDWDIFEDPGTFNLLGSWDEDFDSYATGQDMHGVGGWKGWDNNPVFTAFTSDAQARSTPNSFAIVGNNDPVREFAGANSGQWTVTTWQYIPSGTTGSTYFIMLNTYNDGGVKNWSVQVNFSTANGVVNEGISAGALALVTDQWVEIRLEIDLDADTQTFYYNNQTLYTGSWTNEVSGGGVTNIGAVNLFANSASVVYYDDMSLTGGLGDCGTPGDIPWITVSPTNGSTAPGGSSDVEVTFDSSGLAIGTYEGLLCVSSNDPDTPVVAVPLTLNVEDQTGTLEVDPDSFDVTVVLGMSGAVPMTLTNAGGMDVNFQIYELDGGSMPDSQQITAAPMTGPEQSQSPEADQGTIVLSGPPVGTRGPNAGSLETDPWVTISPTPLGVSRPAGAVVNGNMYLVGGESTGGVRFGQVQIYDPATNSWDNVSAPTMPSPVSNLCAAAVGTSIYVPGGWTGTITETALQVFHTTTNSWETVVTDPLPAARYGSGCASHDGKLYVFGGWDGAAGTNTAWVYDPAASAGTRWTTLPNAPFSGVYGAALSVNGRIFYGGISDNFSGNFADVAAYDPAGNEWITYPSLQTPRGGAGMWAIGNTLYIGGGGWASFLTTVETYDTSLGTGGSWEFTNSLNQGRRTFAYATDAVNGHLYAVAGWAGAFLTHAEKSDFVTFTDVPWLSQDPVSGTVLANSTVVVDVTFNAGLPITQTGQYYATMVIMNDSTSGTINVPVTMTVVSATYGVSVAAEDADLSGAPGGSVEYTVWITNEGDVQDTFDLEVSGNSWDTEPSVTSITLDAGASGSVTVTVDIPGDADDGDMDMATFTATSQSDATATDSVDLTTTAVVGATYGVSVAAEADSLSGEPGSSVTYTIWITNEGDVQDTFDLEVSGNSWDTEPSVTSITLDAGASGSVTVTVDIPGDADEGDMDTATFTATSQSDATATDSVDLTTTAAAAVYYLYLPFVINNN